MQPSFDPRFFEQALNNLNPAQRAAVEQIDGPVMVIAGPGTGKTQILSTRIGFILKSPEAQASPENILCLTYTDAGAVAMRKRLVSMMGSEAYKLTIETFHAFCNRVISENPWHFSKRELRQADELEKTEIMRGLVDRLEAGNPLKRYYGNAYYDVSKLLSFFGDMKKEGWSFTYLDTQTRAWEKAILEADETTRENDAYIGSFYFKRAYKTFKKGDLKQNDYRALVEKFEQTRAAAALYHQYAELMRSEGLYDYDDMMVWVSEAFSDPAKADLLAGYQERYQYILVDEFQDTSTIQNNIVMQVAASYFTENPNLFVVGDDDQSIYRFQGANLKNVTDFADRFNRHLKLVVLEQNYRSNQPILDASESMVNQNLERITQVMPHITKKLLASNPERLAETHPPAWWKWEHPVQEQTGIALEVKQRIDSGVNPSEIALIYRRHAQAQPYVTLFRHLGIPFTLRKAVDVLDEPFTRQFLELLTYLNHEFKRPLSADEDLFRLLHLPFWELNAPIELAKLFAPKARGEERGSFREILDRFKQKLGFPFGPDDQRAAHLARLAAQLEAWIPLQAQMTLQDFIATILHESDILAWVMRQSERPFFLDQLNALSDFLKSESLKNPGITLEAFLHKLEVMQQEGIPLEIVQVNQPKNAVLLTTVHSAKGLEFDHVFMIDCSDKWEKSGRKTQFALPGNLSFHSTSQGEDPKQMETEENRRLFYVGMTRARKNLVLSYAGSDEKGRELSPSMFLEELKERANLKEVPKTIAEEEVSNGLAMLLSKAPEPHIPLPDHDLLDRLLENYRLSPTHLNTYLKCPVTFYFNNVLRIPTARNAALSFGSALHGALDRFFKAAQNQHGVFPPIESLQEMFHQDLYLVRDAFMPADYLRKLEYGDQVLAGWLKAREGKLTAGAVTEKSLSQSVFRDIPLKGQLDKIETDGLKVTIVDYKSGRPKNAKTKVFPPHEHPGPEPTHEEQFGGDYWRQAVFYKIILNNDPYWSQKHVERVIFDLVEPDDKGNFIMLDVQVTPNHEAIVADQMAFAYQSIMNHQFSKGCGKEDCAWCTFTRLHGIAL